MHTFNVPTRSDVSANNQEIFDNLKKGLGFVPNLYATIAYSENGLENYLHFQNGKTSLSKKEKEAVNLIVSQINNCRYCQSAHTLIGKMNGFTDEQILSIRKGEVTHDSKLAALVRLTAEITSSKGRPDEKTLDAFFKAGYTKENLIDVILAIADKVVMNYVHNITQIAIDFPVAQELNLENA